MQEIASAELRILISRQSAIGDVVHGLPVLNALRAAFPNAQLAWLVEPPAACLLDGHRALDQLIEAPIGWQRSILQVMRVRRSLLRFAPSIAIDLQGRTKSALGSWLSGAKRRIGFGDEKAGERSLWFNNVLVATTATHVIDCNLELLKPLHIDTQPVEFNLPYTDAEVEAAGRHLSALGIAQPFAILNVGAGWTSKLWRPERYAQVADYLARRFQMQSLVLWAGSQELLTATKVVEVASAAVLANPTSLRELAALSRLARLFIGSDTGPLHIAAAVNTPCIGMYGPMSAARNGPYGDRHIALQKAYYDGPRPARLHAPPTLMDAISSQDVCQACDQLLAFPSTAGGGSQSYS